MTAHDDNEKPSTEPSSDSGTTAMEAVADGLAAGGGGGGEEPKNEETVADDSVKAMSREELLRHHDLTEKLAAYWEPQMLLCALKWLKTKKRYPEEEINAAMVKALCETLLTQEWQQFQAQRPTEHITKQKKQSDKREQLELYLRPFVKCMTELRKEIKKDPTSFAERRSYKEWSTWYQKRLLDSGEITPGTSVTLHEDCGAKLLEYSRMYYLGGHFEQSAKWLTFFIDYICELTPEGLNFERKQSAYWGLLASLILYAVPSPPPLPPGASVAGDLHYAGDGHGAAGAVELPPMTPEQEESVSQLAVLLVKLDDFLDDNSATEMVPVSLSPKSSEVGAGGSLLNRGAAQMSPVEALAHNKRKKEELLIRRAWVLHWAVWPLFRYYLPRLLIGGRQSFPRHVVWSDLLEWFFREKNLGTVLVVAPHLLRYFAVLAILNRSREDHFKLVCQTVSTASQSNKFSDPFTALLEALFVDFDFDRAQKTLTECSVAAEADFFLAPLQPAIEESARLIIFETYCRIHKSINIDMIAKKLNMTSATAEKWIVNLIRHAKLDAKIDSERNRVEITTEPPNIYQQVVEKTRNVGMRSHLLIQNLEKPGGADRGDVDHRRRGMGYRGMGGAGFGRGGGGRGRN